jgi:hypothetical protein
MSLINLAEQGAGLVKTAGCDGCPDASAVSAQQISGAGTLEFAAPESATLRFVGLGAGGVGAGAGDIQFAIRLQGGTAEVRESGSYRSETSFSAGDRFSISIDNGVVRYARNSSVFYTSGSQASYAVRVHAVFFGANGAIAGIALSGGAGSAVSPPAPAPQPQPAPEPGQPEEPEAPVVEDVPAAPAPDKQRFAIPRPRSVE